MGRGPRKGALALGFAVLVSGCVGAALTSGPDRGPVPRGYERFFNAAPHGFARVTAPAPVRRGERSERFELRNGECGGSDCGNPRYRTELRATGPTDRSRVGTDVWYGWSFYNQNMPSFDADSALRTVVGQWKTSGPAPAAVRLIQMGRGAGSWAECDPSVCTGGGDPARDVVIQLDDMANTFNWGTRQNSGHICRLFSMEQSQGRWVDIVINTNFAADDSGYLNVWIDGEQRCAYRGRIVASDSGGGRRATPNFRHGIFNSYTERWDRSRPDEPKPTMVAYYDEVLVGDTRADVDTRLRQQAGLPPKD